jgi:hypothetical protein
LHGKAQALGVLLFGNEDLQWPNLKKRLSAVAMRQRSFGLNLLDVPLASARVPKLGPETKLGKIFV